MSDTIRRIRDVADQLDEASLQAKRLTELAGTSQHEHYQRGGRAAYKHAARLVRNLAALEASLQPTPEPTKCPGCGGDHTFQHCGSYYNPTAARMIVAGPKMLDALEGVLIHLKRIASVAAEFHLRLPGDGCMLAHYSESHLNTVRDAIAEAKGTA